MEEEAGPSSDAAPPNSNSNANAKAPSPFLRKASKSKLAKQSEVLTDDIPPEDLPNIKMRIPETRVESFDVSGSEGGGLEEEEEGLRPLEGEEGAGEGGAGRAGKVLVRGNALCGDDDTKLRPSAAAAAATTSTVRRSAAGSDPVVSRGLHGSPGSSLSRDSSNDTTHSASYFTDSTGVNLISFIISTLHKNPKDRNMLLNLEEDLSNFIKDTSKQVLKFPSMSSYNRMLVHRTAAFFGLDHNVDQSGGCVVVSKTDLTRLHDTPFRNYIQHDNYYEGAEGPHNKRLSLASTLNQRREIRSFEEQIRPMLLQQQKARSFEERFSENLRIMPQDSVSSAEIMESPISGYSSGSGATGASGGPMLGPGWSSTDSGEGGSHYLRPLSSNSYRPTARAPAQWRPGSSNSLRPLSTSSSACAPRHAALRSSHKAGSFGGVSSGSPSEGSPAGLASPRRGLSTEIGPLPPDASASCPTVFPPQTGQQVLFAIANWDSLPPGAIVLNPATGQPHLNPDGTVYVHPGPSATGPSQTPPIPTSIPYLPTHTAPQGGPLPGPGPGTSFYHAVPTSMPLPLPMGVSGLVETPSGATIPGGASVVTYVMQSSVSGAPPHIAYQYPTTAHAAQAPPLYPHVLPQGVAYVESGGEWTAYQNPGVAAGTTPSGVGGTSLSQTQSLSHLPNDLSSAQSHSFTSPPVSTHGSE